MSGDQPTSSSTDPNIRWMYEGARSMVSRDDYLLGKKIDKNFELYSDVVVKDKDEEQKEDFFRKSLLQQRETSSHQQKVSALDMRIVRTEDPLVALKFQEEQRKRQMLENPLLKVRAQRVLRKAFEKELTRGKKKKKTKKKRSVSSSGTEEEKHRKSEKRIRTHSTETEERRSSKRRDVGRRRSIENVKKNERSRSRTSSNRRSQYRRHRRSSSTLNDIDKEKKRPKKIDRNSTKDHFTSERQEICNSAVEIKFITDTLLSSDNTSNQLPAVTKKLTSEELEARRRTMLENANWRDEMRERNLKDAAEQLRKEQEEMAIAKGPNFIRPLIQSATESSTIEKRLQSNRMKIQREHDHMDKTFARK